MSEEEKTRRKGPKKVPKGESPEAEAAGSPGPGPMGSGDPEAGDSGPMGTKGAQTNTDAASSDTSEELKGADSHDKRHD